VNVNKTAEKAFVDSNIYCEHLILGVSGGPDSQAMLKCVSHVAKNFNVVVIAVGINHGIRKEADSELDLAEDLARECGVRFVRRSVIVPKGQSVQAAAREVRYAALRGVADEYGSSYIATAHHFDDRAETVLIRLLRGKGLGSLGVLPQISGRIFRPLLGVTHEQLLTYCKRWSLKYAEDPSNQNTKYLRVKIRREILPALEAINPSIKNRLNEIADEVNASLIK